MHSITVHCTANLNMVAHFISRGMKLDESQKEIKLLMDYFLLTKFLMAGNSLVGPLQKMQMSVGLYAKQYVSTQINVPNAWYNSTGFVKKVTVKGSV